MHTVFADEQAGPKDSQYYEEVLPAGVKKII